jgi:hypothetical protein
MIFILVKAGATATSFGVGFGLPFSVFLLLF